MSELQAAPARQVVDHGPGMDSSADDEQLVVDAPPVVAVVVASNPGEQFSEMLESLGNQDYVNLSVLVIDAGSDEPIADRVAAVLPEAYLHRLAGDPGFSAAANQAMELVTGSPFLLFCHDDVALDERCVSTLITELYRYNAGIAGPKMVDWDDHRKLLQLGMGSDRFGVLVDQVERGEFDQEQYEAVREVFVAPGGVQLVRSDLFGALYGFDPAIRLIGEDLDLCWRAQALGARVLVVSDAMARHRESMDDRLSLRDRRKLSTRHRLRTVMITATGWSRFTTVPMAMFLIALEGVYYLLTGRRGQAKDMYSAIAWNLGRGRDIRRRRRELRQVRQRTDREVRSVQHGGSAALSNFSRGQFTSGQDRFSGFLGAVRASFQGEDSGSLRDATVIATGVLLVLVFGARHLISRGVVPVGQMPIVPGAGALFEEWVGGWRTTGTGGPGNPPSALALLGLGRLLFFWAPDLFDKLLAVGPVIIGVIGAYRLTRPVGSARSAAVAALFYAASPLIVSSSSAGRWESLVIYAAAPAMMGSLLRIDGASPYGPQGGKPGQKIRFRSLPVKVIRFGVLVTLVAAFAPAVVVVAVIMAVTFGLVSPLTSGTLRWKEFGLATAAAVVTPVALHGPWSFDIMRSYSWAWLVGPRSPEADVDGFIDLLLFAPGQAGFGWLSLGLVAVTIVALAIARPAQLGLAVRGWLVALVMLGLLWASLRGWLPFTLPVAETMLAPALAALVLVVAVGVRSLETDKGSRSLARRGAFVLTGVGVLAAALGAVVMSFDGGWYAPTQNFPTFTTLLASKTATGDGIEPGRVLWIGDASVLPVDVATTASGIQYAVTDSGSPEVWGRWSAGPVGATAGIGEQLDLAQTGETVRLGRLLAPYGVDMVVVVDQLAPAPYEGPTIDPGPGVLPALSQQLDLQRVIGVPDMIVFDNASATGVASALPTAEAVAAVTSADQLNVDLSGGPPIPFETTGSGRWVLEMPEPTEAADASPVLLGVPSDDLTLNGQDGQILEGFDGLAVIPSAVTGQVEIAYPAPLLRRLALFGQLVLVGIGAVLAQTRREVQR